MKKKVENVPRDSEDGTLSRRQMIVGAATAALVASVPFASAKSANAQVRPALRKSRDTSDTPMRRYLAASAALSDGRILVTGGYDRPFTGKITPKALNSAVIYNPASQEWESVAPMSIPRARHSAVTMSDGRVAVLGGMSMNPTASVEIYDPSTDTWTVGAPLDQPRYDHTATAVGTAVYVLGGSAQAMVGSVEVVQPDAVASIDRNP